MRIPGLVSLMRTGAFFSYLLSSVVCDLEESLEGFKTLPTKNGVVQLDEAMFKKYLQKPRSYSVFVALTVSGMKCEPCHIVNEILEKIGTPLGKGPAANKFFVASLPYEKAPNIFNHYKLISAPNLYFYPPLNEKTKDPKYEVYKANGASGFDIDAMTTFLSQQVGEKVSYDKPFPWALYGSMALSFFIAIGSLYIAYYRFTAILYSVKTWSALSMVFLLTMLSGQMWNSIRGAGFAKYARDGSVEWYAGGFQEQYGLESQIVAVAYGLATFVLIQLGTGAPKIKSPAIQSIASIVLVLVFLTSIVFIVTLFKRKFPPYPYKIFFN